MPADVFKHLGMIKEANGDKIQAIAAYRQALETGKNRLSQDAQDRMKSAIERLSQ